MSLDTPYQIAMMNSSDIHDERQVMRTDPGKFFQMRISKQFLDNVDELRKKEVDLPTRAELIRRLVARELEQKRTVHEKVKS
jgi:hypothetical protein